MAAARLSSSPRKLGDFAPGLPEAVIALGGGEGPVQAAQFFHPHHRLVGFGRGKIAHEERIHLK